MSEELKACPFYGNKAWIWVVEMLSRFGKWEPTVGVSLTRENGLGVYAEWKHNNPDNQFRLTQYRRAND